MERRPIPSSSPENLAPLAAKAPLVTPPHRPQRVVRRDARLDVDVREQRRARYILAPHRSLAIRLAQASGNHARTTNTSNLSDVFFSSLLKRQIAWSDAARLPRLPPH